ncbi:hypothetical protein A2U01_0104565, partial [Trifolium medium]|nr:hypothetical protein [Trifolium medium]
GVEKIGWRRSSERRFDDAVLEEKIGAPPRLMTAGRCSGGRWGVR